MSIDCRSLTWQAVSLFFNFVACSSAIRSNIVPILATQFLSSLACISDFTSVVLFVPPSDLSSSSPRRISEDAHRSTIKKGEAR